MSHLWSNKCLTLWKHLSPKAAGSVESETKQQRNKLIIHKDGSLILKHFRLIKHQTQPTFVIERKLLNDKNCNTG